MARALHPYSQPLIWNHKISTNEATIQVKHSCSAATQRLASFAIWIKLDQAKLITRTFWFWLLWKDKPGFSTSPSGSLLPIRLAGPHRYCIKVINSYPPAKEWNWTPILYYTQKLTCIKDLKVRPETIKFIEDKIESSLTSVLALVMWMLTPKAKAMKAKINRSYHVQLKSFYTAKEMMNTMKDNLLNGRKHLWTIHLMRG